MNFYERWQEINIQYALQKRRVVLLNGPRQCGKTTLAKRLVSPNVHYLTLDDITLRQAAIMDPQYFVQHSYNTLIIDEIQRVPSLLIAIKQRVDENTRSGQYLLTGSANIQFIPSVQESLAGRITKIRLQSLSQGEIQKVKPTFLEKIFHKNFADSFNFNSKEEIIEIAQMGGFPEAICLEDLDRKRWHLDYIEAILERDLKDIANIHKLDVMRQLIKILAAWSSKYMDISAICSGLSVRRETLESYMNALEALYLIERVQPWRKTDYDRVAKKSKLFITDTGLMSSILSWNMSDIRYQTDSLGKLIETFVFNELSANINVFKDQYELFHYRDREQREIDFIIENQDQSIIGIEVKSASSVTNSDFKHLIWFSENMARNKKFIGIVLYTGNRVIAFGENLWAIPISMMWQ